MKDRRLTALSSHQSRLKDSGIKLQNIMKENKKILRSNKVSDARSYKSELKEFRDIPIDVDIDMPSLNSNTVQGRELSIELGEYKATLTQTPISSLTDEVSILSDRKFLDKANVIARIPSGIKPLGPILCTRTNEAWACGKDKFIRRFDLRGSLKDKVATDCKSNPTDISMTRQGELIYSDYDSRTVNMFRQRRIETLITLPRGWHPCLLFLTRSEDVLVSMHTADRSHYKIVRYHGQRAIQKIEKDNLGQYIFKGGKVGVCVVENNNGDICASDLNANTVIVMNRRGRVRFRYDGTPARRIRQFKPAHIAVDSLSQIIINDFNNGCLQILNLNGQFLRCIADFGLQYPVRLNVDREGRLWITLWAPVHCVGEDMPLPFHSQDNFLPPILKDVQLQPRFKQTSKKPGRIPNPHFKKPTDDEMRNLLPNDSGSSQVSSVPVSLPGPSVAPYPPLRLVPQTTNALPTQPPQQSVFSVGTGLGQPTWMRVPPSMIGRRIVTTINGRKQVIVFTNGGGNEQSQNLKDIIKESQIINSRRQAPNLKKILTRARFATNNAKVVKKGRDPRCGTCEYLEE
ncbi:uncharacterized protein LOC134274312 [Saccostrea cucullata]|uniref:uncharacterized protein LOC134274312 n=1 Tax=Saccostrea cuccullata TaxID=36930 RepID=UPI002ED08024